MRRFTFGIGLVLAVMIAAVVANAAVTKSIHVEWGYTPPSVPALTGYKLYQSGKPVCTITDPKATSTDCDVVLSAKTTPFTLTATFADGTESEHSSKYFLVYDGPLQPGPTLKSVMISGQNLTVTPVY